MSVINQFLDRIIAWSANKKAKEERECQLRLDQYVNRTAQNCAYLFNQTEDRTVWCSPLVVRDGQVISAPDMLPFEIAFQMPPATLSITALYGRAQSIRRSLVAAGYEGKVFYNLKKHAYIATFATRNELILFKLAHGGE